MKKWAGMLLAVSFLALLSACGTSSNGSITEASIAETAGSSGAWTITMKGGAGDTGGLGGYVDIETYQVQGVKIANTGAAQTGFAVPAYNPVFDPGTNPCIVSSNTSVIVTSTNPDPGSGVLYMVPSTGTDYLYKGTGSGTVTDAAKQCTSLKVNAGATLTLGLNEDTNTDGNRDTAAISFANDVDITGTLKVAAVTTGGGTADTRHGSIGTSRDMGALFFEAPQVFVRSTGAILNKGLNGANSGERGGDGGLIDIYAYNYFGNNGTIDNSGGNGFDQSSSSTTIGGWAGVSSSWGNYLYLLVDNGTGPSSSGSSGGVFINTGKLTTNGGNGSNGGDPAEIFIAANSDVFNTGPITANGGKGTNGAGGDGYHGVYVYSLYGSIYNSGTISQIGGDGTANDVPNSRNAGGGGGYIYLDAASYYGYSGDLVNSGAIIADAGNATVSGTGGTANNVYMYASGAIKTSGRISMNGGNSKGSITGGAAGELWIQNYAPYDYEFGAYGAVRPIQVSGNIYMVGGTSDSNTGGAGGYLYIYQAPSDSSAKSNTGVQLLGYASTDLSGGDGMTVGGGAYDFYIYTAADYAGVGDYSPNGPITNQMNITMRGGKSTAVNGKGGGGGYIDWETKNSGIDSNYNNITRYSFYAGGVSTLTNSGKIDISGGNGGTAGGGNTDELFFYGHDSITNSGAIIMRGGNSVGGNGGYGAYWDLAFYSTGNITNSGTIDTTGGSGTTGGSAAWWSNGTPFGNYVKIYAGGKVVNTGSILCNGGAGTVTNGNGGGIDILSEVGGTGNSAALSVVPGSGTGAAGQKGQVWIDWVQVK